MYQRKPVLLLLVTGAVLMILLSGCGRNPPPEFWNWTPDDSTKIQAVVDQWKARLMSDFDDDTALSEIINYIPDTTSRALRKSMRENKFKPRFFPATFNRSFTTHTIEDSAVVTKDTTVTVKLKETFAGTATIYADSAARYLHDTIINGTTYKFYDSTFSAVETTLTIPIIATSERELYFEPVDKVNRTEWVMKRLSGGARYYSPDAASAPYLGFIQLTTKAGRRDTIVLRPDSIHFGIQRLYNKDSLLSYAVGESVTVVMASGAAVLGHLWWDPGDIIAFLHIGRQRRNIRIAPTAINTKFVFGAADTGLRQIYIEIAPRASLTEITTDFSSTIWGIPINITPAP